MAAPDLDHQRLCSGGDIPVESGILLFPELYAIVRLMPVVPMELTVLGVISFGRVCPHMGWPSHKFFMVHLAQDL